MFTQFHHRFYGIKKFAGKLLTFFIGDLEWDTKPWKYRAKNTRKENVMKKQIFSMLFLFCGLINMVSAGEPFGVFANLNTNSIQFIDPVTQTVSGSLLKGSIGTYEGGLLDVVITPDGKTAIVSNFGDSRVFFIDISGGFEEAPTLSGKVGIGFFAEDMVLSPNGQYLLVTDGSFASTLAVVDVPNRKLIKIYNLGMRMAQAIAITPDGANVLLADYWGGFIHRYTFSADGVLTHAQSRNVLPAWPANITISPDGKTAIAVDGFRSSTPVFALSASGEMAFKGFVPVGDKGGQSCVFSSDGSKAYYLTNSAVYGCRLNVFNITGPGEVVSSGVNIPVRPRRGAGHLFGVDTMAIDPSGNYLYITNPTTFWAVAGISVVDLAANSQVNFIHANGIPTGIAFTTISD